MVTIAVAAVVAEKVKVMVVVWVASVVIQGEAVDVSPKTAPFISLSFT